MNSPKLTIIIPTLNRPDTLHWTLKTALAQDYNNYSILVSDNFSNDNTEQVVNSFNNKKIKYIKTNERLSMSHHWEFAIQHVEEGYVTILGDDDGFLPDSLKKVAALISRYKVEAVGWKFGNYNWKGLPVFFMIPMGNYYRLVNSKNEIKRIFKLSIYDTIQFPSLCGGFISIKLINELKNKYDGNFFHSRIPDFFCGGLIAASIKKYMRIEVPITINATSKHSTGYATINRNNSQTNFVSIQKGKNNIPFHPSLIFLRSNAAPIAEAMLQVHELVPQFPKPDIKKLLHEILAEACTDIDKEKFEELKKGIIEIGRRNNLEDYANRLIQNAVYSPHSVKIKNKFSPVSMNLYIDTDKTQIENIEDACNFAAKIISKNYFLLYANIFKNYFRLSSLLRYLYLKLFSSKRQYL